MNHIQNKILVLISLFFLITLLFTSCNLIGAGTFSNAQYYTLNITEEELIEYIQIFKSMYPEYQFMELQSDGSLEEKKNYYLRNSYIVYFSLPAYGIVMQCVTSKDSKNLGQIGLFAVRVVNSNIKTINTSDLTKKENKEYKKIFESEVLVPLKEFISKDQ